jgi:hypothetical protein
VRLIKRHRRLVLLIVILLVAPIIALHISVQANENKAENRCLAPDAPGCTSGLPTFQYQLLLGEMAAHPVPDVRPLEVDLAEIGLSNYNRVVGGATPMYDKPDGKVVGVYRPGFARIPNIKVRKGDWAQLATNRWIRLSKLTSAKSSTFAGVVFDNPPAYPMAWILQPVQGSAIPGGEPQAGTPMLDRYTRVNIFASVTIGEWDWYLVGPDQWVEQRLVARVTPTKRPEGVKGRWVGVDLYEQVLIAYEDDKMVYATIISSGAPKPNHGTNKGLFRIWARLRQDTMTGGMGGPDYYYLPQVPYVMYFDQAISLHGTYWHDGFGYRKSHGCVNLSITDARWVYEWTSGFYSDTWVYIYATRPYIKLPGQLPT